MNSVINLMIPVLCLSFLLAGPGCSRKINYRESYEGFMGHTLRVYAPLDIPERKQEYTETEINTLLKGEGRKRAFVILIGYFQVHHPDMMRNSDIKREIMTALKKDKIIKKKCDYVKCRGFIDYNLKKVFKIINEQKKIDDVKKEKPVEKPKDNESEKSGTP